MMTFLHFLDEMSRSDNRDLKSRLIVLISHLLKLRYVSGDEVVSNQRGWNVTLKVQRSEVADLLLTAPSLKAHLTEEIATCYARASRVFAREYPRIELPPTCPFTADEILS